MNKLARSIAAARLAAMACLGATAAEKVLLIGVNDSLTGPGAVYGLPQSNSVQMAADEINAAGGIKAGGDVYKLRVIANDDKANPTEATNSVRKLIDRDGVKYLLGFCCSGPTSAVASFIEQGKRADARGQCGRARHHRQGHSEPVPHTAAGRLHRRCCRHVRRQARRQEHRGHRLAGRRFLHPVPGSLRARVRQGGRQDRGEGDLWPEGPRHDAATHQGACAQPRCTAGAGLCRALGLRVSPGYRTGHERSHATVSPAAARNSSCEWSPASRWKACGTCVPPS